MGFLQNLLGYRKICIQCHNYPDADTVASAFGVYRYLRSKGVEASIIYGGAEAISKSGINKMIHECRIPIKHVDTAPQCELLLLVDCQFDQGNVDAFTADKLAIIDHHIQTVENSDMYLIKSNYQSCSTIVWELLREEGYPLSNDSALTVALLYGLYTDTSCFADLFGEADTTMRFSLYSGQALFESLIRSNMTVDELMVASEAMQKHYYDPKRHFAIVRAVGCDQVVLGIIGDFMIQVDSISLSFAYARAGAGYQISIRSCGELKANLISAYVCKNIGNGGGHAKKAGGYIHREKVEQLYPGKSVFELINERLCTYFDML